MRYFIFLEYNGKNYNGFQKQINTTNTIQEEIESGLKRIFKIDIKISIGSRTDKGVHALKNCCHFDTEILFNCEHIKIGLNKILPEDIAILSIKKVKENTSSRFDAKSRRYRFIISNRKNAFESTYYLKKFDLLDVEKMDKIAKSLLGPTNFKSFSKKNNNEKHDYECIIYDSFCTKINDKIIFEIESNRFTHNLIRSLIFNMINAGLGRISIEEFKNKLNKTDRNLKSGITPPNGLTLIDIKYDDDIFIND